MFKKAARKFIDKVERGCSWCGYCDARSVETYNDLKAALRVAESK